MFFRKKKVEPPKPKTEKTVVYDEPKSYEVGKTEVSISFADGRTFDTIVYGYVDQYIDYYMEIHVGKLYVVSSLDKVKNELQSMAGQGQVQSFVNDPQNILESASGVVVGVKIHGTHPHQVEFREARLVEVQC